MGQVVGERATKRTWKGTLQRKGPPTAKSTLPAVQVGGTTGATIGGVITGGVTGGVTGAAGAHPEKEAEFAIVPDKGP
jgi:hypothetical protein